jgi:hypothetical protein
MSDLEKNMQRPQESRKTTMSSNNASMYIADPSLVGSKMFDQFTQIKHVTPLSESGRATGMVLDLKFATIQMNFMPPEDIEAHLVGFENYVRSIFHGHEDDLCYVIARLHSIKLPIGMVTEPDFESEPRIIEFLYEFNNKFNGLLFLCNSVVDFDGKLLVGPLKDSNQ